MNMKLPQVNTFEPDEMLSRGENIDRLCDSLRFCLRETDEYTVMVINHEKHEVDPIDCMDQINEAKERIDLIKQYPGVERLFDMPIDRLRKMIKKGERNGI